MDNMKFTEKLFLRLAHDIRVQIREQAQAQGIKDQDWIRQAIARVLKADKAGK